MKSSFDLAMERLGGAMEQLTAEQKKQLAELNSIYESRIAQAKLRADDQLRQLQGDAEKQDVTRRQLADELARLTSERDSRKDELRRRFKTG